MNISFDDFFLAYKALRSIWRCANNRFYQLISEDSSYINKPPSTDNLSDISNSGIFDNSPFKSVDFMLSIMVLLFGVIVILSLIYLAKIKAIHSEYVFKCIILTLVIIGSLLLITAGYSNNQITGVSGILGSIAGYLLGKTNFRNTTKTNADEDKSI